MLQLGYDVHNITYQSSDGRPIALTDGLFDGDGERDVVALRQAAAVRGWWRRRAAVFNRADSLLLQLEQFVR